MLIISSIILTCIVVGKFLSDLANLFSRFCKFISNYLTLEYYSLHRKNISVFFICILSVFFTGKINEFF